MKLVTYSQGHGAPRVGVVTAAGLLDLALVSPRLPGTLLELIEGGEALLNEMRAVCSRSVEGGRWIALDAVRLLAPLPRPPEFLGVGLNYKDHVAELGIETPKAPLIFNKQSSCMAGPNADILRPLDSLQLDYEGELGIVIGSGARRAMTITEADAAIFGYVVVNDVSVRDWQLSSPTHTLGKSFDTHGPIGPWIVTADDVPNAQALSITTSVNGEVRQRGSTADMIFSCREIVAFLSRYMTLQAGTLVTTGTPAGVGHFRRPPAYLRDADEVTVEISRIGKITNRVVAE